MLKAMADVFPLLLFIFGMVAALKPEWVAAVDRRQKAAGTTRRPSDVEMSETYYGVVQAGGIVFALFGAVLFLNSVL